MARFEKQPASMLGLARWRLAGWAPWLLAVSACAEPPERPRGLVAPPAEAPPPVLAVGFNDPADPIAIEAASAAAPDYSCLGQPLIRVGGPRDLVVLISELYFRHPFAGWCVSAGEGAEVGALGCDPARDPVTDAEGLASDISVAPGRIGLFAGAPPGLRSEVHDVLNVARDISLVDRVASGGFEVPVQTPRVRRLIALTSGRPVPPVSSPGLAVVVNDCEGAAVYGATVELRGRPEAPLYGDGFSLPTPIQPWSHTDGLALFDPSDIEGPTDVLVRVSGRRAADAAPEIVGCARVPLRPRTQTIAIIDPLRAGDPDCGDP